MNPRTTYRAILGWCPGVKAAANFLPDRDVSNRRIVLSLAVVVMVAASSYTLSEILLANAGQPSPALTTHYTNPILGARNGHLYLVVGQQSSGPSFWSGPNYLHLSVYFSELLGNGTLKNTVSLAEVKKGGGFAGNLLLTGNNTWELAYCYYQLGFQSSNHSALYIIRSEDGRTWGTPEITNDKPTLVINPSLLELGDGSQFLLFRFNGTWSYKLREGGFWSIAALAPFASKAEEGEFLYESAFLDREGHVNVVWDESDVYGNDLGIRYSTLVNGEWSEPKLLTSDSVTLNGQEPRIFYSSLRGGYYLFVTTLKQTGDPNWFPVTQVYFSSDWVSWEPLSYFSTWDYSIIELPDGALAKVSLDYNAGEQSVIGNLYLARSQDGISWSSPVKISQIENNVVLSEGATVQRSMASYVVTLLASLAALVLVIRAPHIFSRLSPELSK